MKLADQLPYKVRKELQSVVQLVQAYARLTELELATGEKGPSFGPLPLKLPENIRQQIIEWTQREQAKAEAKDSQGSEDEGLMGQLASIVEAQGGGTSGIRYFANKT